MAGGLRSTTAEGGPGAGCVGRPARTDGASRTDGEDGVDSERREKRPPRVAGGRSGGSTMLRRTLLAGALVALVACGGNPSGDPVRVTVPQGSGFSAVADSLAAKEIVETPRVFGWYARFRGSARSIKPGVYEFQRGTAWDDVLAKLVAGDVVRDRLTIPEGWTVAQMAPRLARASGVPADSVLRLLTDTVAPDRFEVPGPTLEGYLYPATYEFPAGTPVERVVGQLVSRYRQVWAPELRARADSLGMSEREVVTLASIVEKEAKAWGERDTIAAVYHNRLRIGMPLQADPTVQYALGRHQSRLLYSHIDSVADNPYNTYRNRGLPPGPIASPSEGAIRATLYPADVPFLYFVARPDGTHVFTRSLQEHNRAKQQSRRELDAGSR